MAYRHLERSASEMGGARPQRSRTGLLPTCSPCLLRELVWHYDERVTGAPGVRSTPNYDEVVECEHVRDDPTESFVRARLLNHWANEDGWMRTSLVLRRGPSMSAK